MSQQNDTRFAVIEKLSVSPADYRSIVGEKKFDSRIRKTARKIEEDIARAQPKKSKKDKKTEPTETMQVVV